MSAVRASPHSSVGSAWTMPAPGLAPEVGQARARQSGAGEHRGWESSCRGSRRPALRAARGDR